MRIAVVAHKGGVGKTVTAIHLAGVLAGKGSTLLLDGDDNLSSLAWRDRGPGLPFEVVDAERVTAAQLAAARHVVIDTQARATRHDLRALVDRCDLMLIPAVPDALSLHALGLIVDELRELAAPFRVLVTIVPPRPSHDGQEALDYLKANDIPACKTMVRRLAAFSKAALAGCLVRDVPDPRAELGWADYQAVAKELMR